MQEGPARPQAAEAEFQELSLGDLFLMLWRGRWIILICTVVLTGIGFKYVQQRGTVWRATSRLYVDASSPSMLSADGNLVSMGSRNYANTQAELLRSTKVLDQTLLRPEIAASPLFPEAANKVSWLMSALKVSVGIKDDILSVSLDDAEVEEACLIVNGVVDTFRRLHSEKGNTRARELKAIAVSGRDKEQVALDALQGELIEFLSANGSIALDDRAGGTYATRQLDSAFQELRKLEADFQIATTRLETARSLESEPRLMRDFLGETAPAYDRKSDRIAELQLNDLMRRSTELADELRAVRRNRIELLEQKRTAENPSVVVLDKQIADLESQQDSVRLELSAVEDRLNSNEQAAEALYAQKLLANLERQHADMALRLDSSRTLYTDLETAAKAVAPKRAELRRLETRIAQSEAIIEGLNKEISDYSQADINEEDRSKITIEILDRASPDTAKVAASVPKTLAIFFLLGGLLGCGLAWLRALLDRKVRSEEDVTRATGLPLIGALPRTKLREQKADAIQAWDEHHALAEAARTLRTAISFSMPKGKGTVLQVTSADKGDGKSTTSSQLAIAMAQAGQRTLIIDADLRSPRVAKVFHLGNEDGLSNILAQDVPFDQVVRPTRIDNLDVLTSGPIPINPAELLNSEAFGALLDDLQLRYDRILIDTPPVLAVSDARVVAVRAEATLLVARVDKTNRKRAESAVERLTSVGARVLGVILNDVPRGIGYGYGYGYGYGSRYGYGDTPGIDLGAAGVGAARRNGAQRNGAAPHEPTALPPSTVASRSTTDASTFAIADARAADPSQHAVPPSSG
ncbi:MAG: polysaccharide biosynthesis tyrosine autokinase, partial [Planctomycetota bacterium]